MLYVACCDVNIFSKLMQRWSRRLCFSCFSLLFFFPVFVFVFQNSAMRPAPQTNPANQQTTHPQPSHNQMMSGQVRLKHAKTITLECCFFFSIFFLNFDDYLLQLILRRKLNVFCLSINSTALHGCT